MRAANRTMLAAALLLIQGCGAQDASLDVSAESTSVPRPDHVVIAIMENTGYSTIVNSSSAPYIHSLMSQGASFTNSHAVTHPSQPNYVALFAGDPHGVTDDSCPRTFTNVANLGSQLLGASFTFTAYSEDLPSAGFTGCTSGKYARKHAPWVDFNNVPGADHVPFTSFPSDFSKLPTVSFVVPNLCNDMHDCSIATGDTWLKSHLDAYAQWAKAHNSLLILTWDEDDFTSSNQIPTVFVGANVQPGNYSESINHYNVLHTVEAMYGLSALGNSAAAITDVWATSTHTDDFSIAVAPTALTLAQGATATATASTTVTSGNAQTATLTATGAPAGATVTLTPSSITTGASAAVTVSAGTTTPPGTYAITITATGSAATHTTTLSVTVTGTTTGGITNGDFEVGSLSGWTATGTTAVATSAHGGHSAAQVGGTSPTNGDSALAQTFTAPTGTSTLGFWYDVRCDDTVRYDWATATLTDNTASTTKTILAQTCNNDDKWVQVTTSIVAGHSYTLKLVSHDDNYTGDPTYTLFDDVTLQ